MTHDHGEGPGLAGLLTVLLPLLAAAVYVAAVVRLRRRGDGWSSWRTASALGALVLSSVSLLPPLLHAEDVRVHVAQHLASAMLAPVGIAVGAPVTLALRTLAGRPRGALVRVLHSGAARVVASAPVVLLLDTGGTWAVYATPLFARLHDDPSLHVVVHLHMVLAGCLFAWWVVGADPRPRPPSTATRLGVLVVAGAAHDVLARVLYADPLPGPHARAGAELLAYGGEVVDVLLAAAVMAQWYARTGRRWRHEQRRGTISGTAAAP